MSLYALGVARNVLKESRRATPKNMRLGDIQGRALLMNSQQDEQQRSEKLDLAKRLVCLEKCMRALPDSRTEACY